MTCKNHLRMKAVMAKINDSHIPLCHKELKIQTYASKLQLELVYHKMASQYSLLLSQTKSSPNSFYYTGTRANFYNGRITEFRKILLGQKI
jgi:hypothetical protein